MKTHKSLFYFPVLLFFAFTLSCKSKRSAPDGDREQPISFSKEAVSSAKVDGKKLSLAEASADPVLIGSGNNRGILVASEGAPGTEYIEYVLCKKNEDWCGDVNTFVRSQGLISDAPKGDYIVKMRACVDPYNAVNPKENCGPWKEQLITQATDNTKLGALLNDYKKVVAELKVKCLMLHKRAREDFTKPTTAPEDKEFAAKLAQYFTPEICASFAESQDSAAMMAELEKQQAVEDKQEKKIETISAGLMVGGAIFATAAGIGVLVAHKKYNAFKVDDAAAEVAAQKWSKGRLTMAGLAVGAGITAVVAGGIMLGYQKYQEKKENNLALSSGSSSNLMKDYSPLLDEIMALGQKARGSYQTAFGKM